MPHQKEMEDASSIGCHGGEFLLSFCSQKVVKKLTGFAWMNKTGFPIGVGNDEEAYFNFEKGYLQSELLFAIVPLYL